MKPTTRSRARPRQVGRHAKHPILGENRPGTILLLSLIGALPIIVLFVVGQTLIASRGVHPIEVWPTWRALFYVMTPIASGWALWFHRRAPPWAREHNAARWGRRLGWANLFIWLVYGGLYLVLFGLA